MLLSKRPIRTLMAAAIALAALPAMQANPRIPRPCSSATA